MLMAAWYGFRYLIPKKYKNETESDTLFQKIKLELFILKHLQMPAARA
jgi:hypothetical protein